MIHLVAGSSHCDPLLISQTSENRVLVELNGSSHGSSYMLERRLQSNARAIFTSARSTHSIHYPIMSDLATIRQLVKDIGTLSSSLSDLVPKGTKDDKIWSVMNCAERETPHETFNYRFDALFAEDCHDSDGRLHHVRQGKFGMGFVALYLLKLNWAVFPLDIVTLKLQRLLGELKKVQCVQVSIVCN